MTPFVSRIGHGKGTTTNRRRERIGGVKLFEFVPFSYSLSFLFAFIEASIDF
ncbi:hypothetical protein U14_03331 [Candidatus Moduliflexus flocculans]|uniref:Uncharacterized protein n=1 Tax=Candidatus Moduliflexus flocculans TaxID=1499966 RepID=A0A081BNW8_9BACT|nr:hypothetical protein U14_03331 [Candidatus Moduliflexus flocculans]